MTAKLDPTEKAIRREARLMAAHATRQHESHQAPDDWCRKCAANEGAALLGLEAPYPVPPAGEALVQAILEAGATVTMTTARGEEPYTFTAPQLRDLVEHGKGPRTLELARQYAAAGKEA